MARLDHDFAFNPPATLANRLAHEVLGRTLDELPPQTRRLLEVLHGWAATECARLALRRADLRFSRRQLRALTGWGDTQPKVHLSRLADLEYLLVHRVKVGQGFEYELLYDGEGAEGDRILTGLAMPGYDAPRSAPAAARSAPGRGMGGRRAVPGRSPESAAIPQITGVPGEDADAPVKMPLSRLNGNGASYPQPIAATA